MDAIGDGHDAQPDLIQQCDVEFALFHKSDTRRQELMQTLVKELQDTRSKLDEVLVDHANEKDSRRTYQRKVDEARKEIQALKSKMDRDQYVLALIDGDGAQFLEQLLAAGHEGGSEAAHKLRTEIYKYIEELYGSCAQWSIMVQIFANFEGLSRKLASIGILKSPSDIHAFARAFSYNQPLFNFIDVGSGKERADHKIKESFRLYVNNCQCKHIFFGGTHDNGYLPNLEPYRRDKSIASHITLLETTPAEQPYLQLGFSITSFPSVFRKDPLPDTRQHHYQPTLAPSHIKQHHISSSSETNPNWRKKPSPPPSSSTPPPPARSPAVQETNPPLALSPTASQFTPVARAAVPISQSLISTYAGVGGNLEGGVKELNIAPTKPTSRRQVVYNAAYQRLDPPLGKASQKAMSDLKARIAQHKLCNKYHISGRCHENSLGHFEHGERLSPDMQLALRNIARERVCSWGSTCDDADCVSGHQCPRGEKCHFENCYFTTAHEDLHLDDTKSVYRKNEDGSMSAF